MADATQPEVTEEKKEFEFNWGPPAPVDPPATKDLSGQKVKLESADGKEIEVPVEAARMSVTLRNMMDGTRSIQVSVKWLLLTGLPDFGDANDTALPLPNVSSTALEKIMEYCTWHFVHWVNAPEVREGEYERKTTEDIIPWDKAFASGLDRGTLYEVVMAANFLDVKPLLDLGCKTVAIGIKGSANHVSLAQQIKTYGTLLVCCLHSLQNNRRNSPIFGR